MSGLKRAGNGAGAGAGTAGAQGPGLFSEGPNARSKTVTVADGDDTYGVSIGLFPTHVRLFASGGAVTVYLPDRR